MGTRVPETEREGGTGGGGNGISFGSLAGHGPPLVLVRRHEVKSYASMDSLGQNVPSVANVAGFL